MSAPKTNIEKQKRRHRGPLFGISVAVGVAVILFLIWLAWVFYYGGAEEEADTGITDPPVAVEPLTE